MRINVSKQALMQDELCRACLDGDLPRIQQLIAQNVPIQVQDDVYSSPLGAAIRAEHPDVVRLLIDNGLSLEGRVGEEALLQAASCCTDIIALLIPFVPVDARNQYGETALMRAASANNVSAIPLLLEQGAAIDAVDNDRHYTALHLAANNVQRDAYDLLLQYGADQDRPSAPLVDLDPNWNGLVVTPRQLLEIRIREMHEE